MSHLCALVLAALVSRTEGKHCEDGRNSFLSLLLASPCPTPQKVHSQLETSALSLVPGQKITYCPRESATASKGEGVESTV